MDVQTAVAQGQHATIERMAGAAREGSMPPPVLNRSDQAVSGVKKETHNSGAEKEKKAKKRKRGKDGEFFFELVAQGAENGHEKCTVSEDRVEDNDVGVFLSLKGMQIICMYEEYLHNRKLIPLFHPKGECNWFPSGAHVEVEFIRWDPSADAFFCSTGRADKLNWKRACVDCVSRVFAGDADTCRAAVYGETSIRTHCNACKPPSMEVGSYKFCVECQKQVPEYGWPNCTRKTHCNSCKRKGMIKLNFKRCEVEGCKRRANFGMDGTKTHCNEHKNSDMELAFKACMRCKTAKATEGRNGRVTHCGDCMKDVVAGVKSATAKRKTGEDGDGKPTPKRKRQKAAKKAAEEDDADDDEVDETKADEDVDDNSSVRSGDSATSNSSEGSGTSSLTDDSNGQIRTKPDLSPVGNGEGVAGFPSVDKETSKSKSKDTPSQKDTVKCVGEKRSVTKSPSKKKKSDKGTEKGKGASKVTQGKKTKQAAKQGAQQGPPHLAQQGTPKEGQVSSDANATIGNPKAASQMSPGQGQLSESEAQQMQFQQMMQQQAHKQLQGQNLGVQANMPSMQHSIQHAIQQAMQQGVPAQQAMQNAFQSVVLHQLPPNLGIAQILPALNQLAQSHSPSMQGIGMQQLAGIQHLLQSGNVSPNAAVQQQQQHVSQHQPPQQHPQQHAQHQQQQHSQQQQQHSQQHQPQHQPQHQQLLQHQHQQQPMHHPQHGQLSQHPQPQQQQQQSQQQQQQPAFANGTPAALMQQIAMNPAGANGGVGGPPSRASNSPTHLTHQDPAQSNPNQS
mmetsp:Transcript_22414/g.41994  ORF Transcript_22414/g.41994 Transcript_22414/m.41994 type:complete len:788 (-) Transcript_22414:15-2378(-)